MSDGLKLRRELMKELNESCLLFQGNDFNSRLKPVIRNTTSKTTARTNVNESGDDITPPLESEERREDEVADDSGDDVTPTLESEERRQEGVASKYFEKLQKKRQKSGQDLRRDMTVAITKHVWWLPSDMLGGYTQKHEEVAEDFAKVISRFCENYGTRTPQWLAEIKQFESVRERANIGKAGEAAWVMHETLNAWRMMRPHEILSRPIVVKYSEAPYLEQSFGADYLALTLVMHALQHRYTPEARTISKYLSGLGTHLCDIFKVKLDFRDTQPFEHNFPQFQTGENDGREFNAAFGMEIFVTAFQKSDGKIDWEGMLTFLRNPSAKLAKGA